MAKGFRILESKIVLYRSACSPRGQESNESLPPAKQKGRTSSGLGQPERGGTPSAETPLDILARAVLDTSTADGRQPRKKVGQSQVLAPLAHCPPLLPSTWLVYSCIYMLRLLLAAATLLLLIWSAVQRQVPLHKRSASSNGRANAQYL